jgi:hypothetical protein
MLHINLDDVKNYKRFLVPFTKYGKTTLELIIEELKLGRYSEKSHEIYTYFRNIIDNTVNPIMNNQNFVETLEASKAKVTDDEVSTLLSDIEYENLQEQYGMLAPVLHQCTII